MSKKTSKFYIVTIIFLIAFIAGAIAFLRTPSLNKMGPEKNYDIKSRMEMTAGYFVNNQRSNGYFAYGYDFLNGRPSRSDSVVYQSYAGYVLSNYFSYIAQENNLEKYVYLKDSIANLLKAFEASSVSYDFGKVVSFIAKTANSREFIKKELSTTKVEGDIVDNSVVATVFAYLTEKEYRQTTGDKSFENVGKEWFDAIDFYATHKYEEYQKSGEYNIPEEVLLALSVNLDKKEKYKDLIKTAWSDNIYKKRYDKGNLKLWFDAIILHNMEQYTKDKYYADALVKEAGFHLTELYPEIMPEYNSCMFWYAFGLTKQYIDKKERSDLYIKLENRTQLEKVQNLRFQILPQQEEFIVSGDRKFFSKDFSSFSGAFVDTSINLQTTLPYTQFCMQAMMEDAKSEENK